MSLKGINSIFEEQLKFIFNMPVKNDSEVSLHDDVCYLYYSIESKISKSVLNLSTKLQNLCYTLTGTISMIAKEVDLTVDKVKQVIKTKKLFNYP